ncbi:hypothetical protein SAMN04488556_3652 [Halostagnicola kamekurae]|uniref:Uncharacterized protein n=1 Tax=Halostagnicola kamekurae TaxID=619731 RepID=A0A1I6U919_9EURY|nr:hypothetical protein SAMN04488556_3652 [Halostagnicola kamekurae]
MAFRIIGIIAFVLIILLVLLLFFVGGPEEWAESLIQTLT